MAAGILSAPGTEYGPCEDVDCGHTDCAATRAQAASLCRYCDKPIGYETRFYNEDQGCVHALCAEVAEEERFAAACAEAEAAKG